MGPGNFGVVAAAVLKPPEIIWKPTFERRERLHFWHFLSLRSSSFVFLLSLYESTTFWRIFDATLMFVDRRSRQSDQRGMDNRREMRPYEAPNAFERYVSRTDQFNFPS